MIYRLTSEKINLQLLDVKFVLVLFIQYRDKNVNYTFLRKKSKDYINVCSTSSEYKAVLNVSFLVDLFSDVEIKKLNGVHLNAVGVNEGK